MESKINVIGFGGAFDVEERNSSFLIANCILFDCGSTVFSALTNKQTVRSWEADFSRKISTSFLKGLDRFKPTPEQT